MPLNIQATQQFRQRFLKLPSSIQNKAEKKTQLFKQNPNHPSLHLEKLEPKHLGLWSVRIDRNYRVIFSFGKNNAIILRDIGKLTKCIGKFNVKIKNQSAESADKIKIKKISLNLLNLLKKKKLAG